MAEFTFKLKSDAKEYPARFGGQEVILTLPDTLDGIRGMVADGVDQDAAIHGLCVGQGLRLTKQKKVKDVLGAEKYTHEGKEVVLKDLSVEEALRIAREAAESMKIGAPRAKREGGGKGSKRVAEAEAKASAATTALRDTYLAVPPAVRKNLRPQLVAQFGEETVAGWESASK